MIIMKINMNIRCQREEKLSVVWNAIALQHVRAANLIGRSRQ
jgi:hypothetical protein